MRRALDTAALGLSGLCLGLAAGALPAAAAAASGPGLSRAQLALALGLGLGTRALSSGVAGALVDRFGARRSLRAAAAGAAAAALGLGLLFGSGREGTLFLAAAILHAALAYFLGFALPAAARVNASRLERAERGRHAGLYGALAFPAELLALPAGLWLGARAPAAVFALVPAGAALLAFAAALVVPAGEREDGRRPFLADLRAVALRRETLALAALSACAGAARWGLLGWSAQFLSELHRVRSGSPLFAPALATAACGAFLGPVLAGLLSDKVFRGRRAPAAAACFASLAAALAALGRVGEPAAAVACLGAACAAAFGAHSLLAGAAAMDAGGRRSAGALSGLLDGVHHAAGGLAIVLAGAVIDRGGWGGWTSALVPFALAGAALSIAVLKAEARDPAL